MRRADQSDVGDVKLFTLQHASTIGARSIKQVRFLDDRVLKGELIYRMNYRDEGRDDEQFSFRVINDKASGLGEPLPRGRLALFQATRLGRHPLGEVGFKEKAVGELIDIDLPEGIDNDVDFDDDEVKSDEDGNWTLRRLTVSNDKDVPITAEVTFIDTADYALSRFSRPVEQRDGRPVWRVVVPPGKARSIRFRSTDLPDREDY
jgi:hypothetical protein